MTSAPASPPLPLVEVTRGDLIESVHRGSFSVVSGEGAVLASGGDLETPVYPRSALKPFQAVAMVRAGLTLPPELLALAAASHSGSPAHLAGVVRILEGAGLDVAALRNVPDLPTGEAEREDYLRAGGAASSLAQTCSGKHAAMLATCVVNGWSTGDYLDPGHPLQQAVARTLAELTGAQGADATVDGCGTPLWAFPLEAIARAMVRLAAAEPGTAEEAVFEAMSGHPDMVAGEGRDTTGLMRAVPGLIAKDGAEAVEVVAVRRPLLGLALKIADGGDRGRLPATERILRAVGVDAAALADVVPAPVLGGGHPVGALRPSRELDELLG